MKYNIEIINVFHDEEKSMEQRKETFNRQLLAVLEQEILSQNEESYDREQ